MEFKALSHEEKLDIGRRVHIKEFRTIPVAVEHLGLIKSSVYRCLAMYRDANGLPSARATAIKHKAERVAAKPVNVRGPYKPKTYSNGNALAVVRSAQEYENAIALLNDRNKELQNQLDHALTECHTLQRLLMTVGTTL